MKPRTQIILSIVFPVYLITVLFTDISLTGFWTDGACTLVLTVYACRIAFKNNIEQNWLRYITISLNFLGATAVVLITTVFFSNMFWRDTLKLRTFYWQRVDGRLFNAYFKPVGAYSGGYGNFWINETPKYFPFLEWRVYWDRTVHWDFNADTFDGQPVDNYEIVRGYIEDEVIKHKDR